jgi:chromosome segregation ATPase
VEAASCLAVVCKPVNPESRAEYAQSVRLDELQQQVADLQKQCATLRQQKDELAAVWTAVQQSASWRMLDKWRKVRERVAPPQSLRRRLYDSIVGAFRKH